ncbi:CvpA family protein [Tenacibaculum sp. C7A-26P2]|uniref:CvpA family protein n=1 Tax=Tenacibaculum sp. C7A-26P2 TaxID=3447504 RepID=UPI003F870702
MNTFDFIVAVCLLYGFVKGLWRGLFVEVSSLLALLSGVYGGIHFSHFLGEWLKKNFQWDQKYISLVAFAGTFIVIVIVINLMGKIFTKIADFAALGILNKILGGVFGFLKVSLILSVAFIFFGKMNNFIPFVKQESLEKSILYEPVKSIASIIFPSIINVDQEKEPNQQT